MKKTSHHTNKKGAYYDESGVQNNSSGNYYIGSSADKKNPLRQSMPLENLQKIKELYELPSPKAATKKSKFQTTQNIESI